MKEIKEEVYKCSKCGLCKSVCPIFLATKNEVLSPRGRFIILNNFFNNQKKLSKKFLNNLDYCLNCNLCKKFCPSDIDSSKIFNSIKRRNTFFYLKLFFFFLKSIFTFKKKYSPKIFNDREKIIYFEGCFNKYINPSDRNETIKLIENLGYEVEKIISNCCGYPYLNNNDLKSFKKNSKKITKKYSTNTKYIVCSCDSCFDTLSKIEDESLKSKLIRLDDFLTEHNFNIETKEKTFYFKPLIRKEDCTILNKYEKLNKKTICSLMENFFLIKHTKDVNKIINTMNLDIKEIENATIITTCQLSKYGLNEVIKKKKTRTNILTLSEYINLLTNKE